MNENSSADQMIKALVKSYEQLIKDFRSLSDIAEKEKDFGLVDLLGGILRDHEKTAWMLRAHL